MNWFTLSNGRDHEIVRAFKSHRTAIPWNIEMELFVFLGLQV